MFAVPNFLVFSREPLQFGMIDNVIERQEPPKIARRIGKSPVPDVGNPQLPVDALVGDPAGLRAVLGADDRNGFFHGKFQIHETLNKARRLLWVSVEISHVLRAGEHTAMETDYCNPLSIFLFPSERFECFFPATQMSNHGVSVMRVLSVSRYVNLDAHRVDDDQVGRYDRHEHKLHRGGPRFPGYLPLLPGPDEDKVDHRPMRLSGIGLNPKDDILDPEFFQGDPGGEQGDFLVARREGRIGQIGGEEPEAARPVFLGRRPPAAEVVMGESG